MLVLPCAYSDVSDSLRSDLVSAAISDRNSSSPTRRGEVTYVPSGTSFECVFDVSLVKTGQSMLFLEPARHVSCVV